MKLSIRLVCSILVLIPALALAQPNKQEVLQTIEDVMSIYTVNNMAYFLKMESQFKGCQTNITEQEAFTKYKNFNPRPMLIAIDELTKSSNKLANKTLVFKTITGSIKTLGVLAKPKGFIVDVSLTGSKVKTLWVKTDINKNIQVKANGKIYKDMGQLLAK